MSNTKHTPGAWQIYSETLNSGPPTAVVVALNASDNVADTLRCALGEGFTAEQADLWLATVRSELSPRTLDKDTCEAIEWFATFGVRP